MKLNFQSASNQPMQHLGLPGICSPCDNPSPKERRKSTIMNPTTFTSTVHTSKSNPNIQGMINENHSTINNNNIYPNNSYDINNRKNVASTLSVNSVHLVQRRSVIGRPDKRSSFQAQRLSDVGVAVGQQITAKMGLRLPASQERIVEQTRWLYLRYIFDKLRQKSLPLRDLNLTKSLQARRAAALGKHYGKISQSAPTSANVASSSDHNFGPFERKISPQITRRDRSNRMNHHLDSDDLFDGISWNLRLNSNYNHMVNNGDLFNNNNEENSETNSNMITGSRKFIMDPTLNKQILSVIMSINKELHDTQPELYDDSIYELIGIDKFTSIDDLLDVQKRICQEMTRSEISWVRIVALFSLFGAMSLDCVRLGSPEHVGPILDGFLGFVERDLALWISQQGGWEAFLYKYRVSVSYVSIVSRVMILSSPIILWFAITMLK